MCRSRHRGRQSGQSLAAEPRGGRARPCSPAASRMDACVSAGRSTRPSTPVSTSPNMNLKTGIARIATETSSFHIVMTSHF